MKIDYKLYQFTSKKLRDLAEKNAKEQRAMIRAAKAFAKKVGADPTLIATGSHKRSGTRIAGFHFNKTPDRTTWMHIHDGAWRPKKKTTLYKEFEALPKVDLEELVKAVEWKDIWHGGYFYTFNPFWDKDPKFCGMSVPVFHPKDYKENPEIEYKPVKGMKEITKAAYYRRMPK